MNDTKSRASHVEIGIINSLIRKLGQKKEPPEPSIFLFCFFFVLSPIRYTQDVIPCAHFQLFCSDFVRKFEFSVRPIRAFVPISTEKTANSNFRTTRVFCQDFWKLVIRPLTTLFQFHAYIGEVRGRQILWHRVILESWHSTNLLTASAWPFSQWSFL